MASIVKRGLLIVVEGLDRCGKTTLVSHLEKALSARIVKFPERTTPIGQMIDGYLRQHKEMNDQAVHLLFSANRWEAVSSIEQTLAIGQSVVCDRYAFSGIAYSMAKGLDFDWCRAPDVGLPAPDLVLFLQVSPNVAATRGGFGEERYEKKELQAKVATAFQQIAQLPSVQPLWHIINADNAPEQVANDCLQKVKSISGSQNGPITGKLFT